MEKLTKHEVKELVQRIRNGEGDDKELAEWIEKISISTANPEVIKTIMAGKDANVDDIVEKLYSYKPIIL